MGVKLRVSALKISKKGNYVVGQEGTITTFKFREKSQSIYCKVKWDKPEYNTDKPHKASWKKCIWAHWVNVNNVQLISSKMQCKLGDVVRYNSKRIEMNLSVYPDVYTYGTLHR